MTARWLHFGNAHHLSTDDHGYKAACGAYIGDRTCYGSEPAYLGERPAWSFGVQVCTDCLGVAQVDRAGYPQERTPLFMLLCLS